jgi:hypothetical protein
MAAIAALGSVPFAIHLFVVRILSGGAGPRIVGLLNDSFQAEYGDAGIRHSLVWVQAVALSRVGVC